MLSPRPPVRALLIAAGAALVGALLVIGSGVFGWPGFLAVTGALVLVLGCVLGGVAAVVSRRMRVTVAMDDEGYRIAGAASPQQGRWADVTKVTQAPGRLVLQEGERRVTLVDPSGGDRALTALGAQIGRFLDRSRGYGQH